MFQLPASVSSKAKRAPRSSAAMVLVVALVLLASIGSSASGVLAGTPGPTGQEPLPLDKGKLNPNKSPDRADFIELCNVGNITIPSSGTAQPYPSVIFASGLSGYVSEIRVDLQVVGHTYPDDLDILLVGPTGARSLLMSDVGGSYDLINDTLHLLTGAPALPDNGQIASGFYSPTDFEAGDAFPAPAPAGPYAARLANFVGTTPNGDWSLYIVDDAVDDQGSISRGWCLQIYTSTVPTVVPTFTPTPTSTPRPTNTPTPPSDATSTPASCPIMFTDVPPTHPFYTYIRCLVCRGIVSGYVDNTFRPGNDITRGQIAKIVSNAANFVETVPAGQQTFADVPSPHPFWIWIERMASRGIISGYTCGGPNEPCDQNGRPYFRAGSNTSRGQIAKIVSNAAGFNDNVPLDQQSFEDVTSTNPYWIWVERLAGRGIMSGYNCGGPNEPCGPFYRPYFRWPNSATRGQAAKIIANTFFPNCEIPARK